MIQKESVLTVVDNAGLLKVKCIHVYSKNNVGCVGDWVLVSVQKRLPFKKFMLQGKTFLSLIVSTKKNIRRNNGHYISFGNNRVVSFLAKDSFKGTSIKKPLAKESKIRKDTGNFILVAHPRKFK